MIVPVTLAGGLRELDGAAKQRRGFVGAQANGREPLVARLVARRDRAVRARREVVVMQLLDGLGGRLQQARRPQRTRDVVTAALELGREPAVQDDRFVVSPHLIPRQVAGCRAAFWVHGDGAMGPMHYPATAYNRESKENSADPR